MQNLHVSKVCRLHTAQPSPVADVKCKKQERRVRLLHFGILLVCFYLSIFPHFYKCYYVALVVQKAFMLNFLFLAIIKSFILFGIFMKYLSTKVIVFHHCSNFMQTVVQMSLQFRP